MTFLLAHLSDPHIGPLPRIPLRNLMNKRLTGALNWHGARASIHNMDVLAEIITDLRQQAPDHVALTGDLVNVGYAPEFPLAKRQLDALGPSEFVSIIPGNHDAYIPGSLRAMEAVFGAHMLGDAASSRGEHTRPSFPYLRVRQNIALIGVNTGIATLPFMATGLVGAAQRRALRSLLSETEAAGLFRVMMIHHPPMVRGAAFGRGLHDAKAMMQVLREVGADLILHGHNHRFSERHVAGPSGPIPVIGVGSASAVPGTAHHRAEYNLIRLDPGAPCPIRITRRGLAPDSRRIEWIGEEICPGRSVC